MPVNTPYSSNMEKEVQKAANIINSFFKNSTVEADSTIPAELIKNCAGLAFLTVIKAGMIWTGKVGTGVVIARLDDGSWSAPSGIGTAGVGFGAEIGGEIVDFMIVLGSKSAVKTFMKGTQVSVGAGLELAVGPMGRAAGANVNAGGGGVSANYTYSRAKGAFAGVGLHGSTIMVRGEMNSKFYGRDVSPMEILSGHVQAPSGACDRLYEAIAMAQCQEGVNMYPPSDPRSSSYGHSSSMGASSRGSFEGRSSFNHATSSSGGGGGGNASFNHSASGSNSSSSRASLSAPSTTQPGSNDPRLHRYQTYKSEKELYDQYAKNKSPAAAASTSTNNASSYGAGFAAPAPVGYAAPAAAGYGYGSAAPAPVAAPAAAAAAPTRLAYKTVPVTNYVPNYGAQPAPAAAPAPSPYAAAGYGYTAPGAAAPPAPAPTRLSYTTVPATTYAPHYGASTSSAPMTPKPQVPPPTAGAETKQVYTHVIQLITTKCPHANVQVFKDNCRLFGQDQMSLDAYLAYLTSICTTPLMKELVPQLVRLLPTQDKREGLWALYVRDVLMIR